MSTSPPSPRAVLFSLLLLSCGNDIQVAHGVDLGSLQVATVESLIPEAVCSAPKEYGPNRMQIIPGHGPCSPSPDSKADHHQILAHDKLKIAYIEAILSSFDGGGNATDAGFSKLVSLPAKWGGGRYLVTIGLGTPSRPQTVEIDTGSAQCWVQCKSCLQQNSCYPQQEPIFDPSASSTYRQILCTSDACELGAGQCGSDRECRYTVVYVDKSYSNGTLAEEKLTLTPTAIFPNFVFGCGDKIRDFDGIAGLFGLARNPLSLVSQTGSNVFSYCLPPTTSSTGHLTLGNSSYSTPVYYTPMLTNRPYFYFVELIGISVGGVPLPVEPAVFQTGGTILDSGTTLTYLPPSAYNALKLVFRSNMSQLSYPETQPRSKFLDTCFNFAGVTVIRYPRITLHYTGANVSLPFTGTFLVIDVSQVCLAFASTTGYNLDTSIIGNVQQSGFEVIHDISAQRIGFTEGTCG